MHLHTYFVSAFGYYIMYTTPATTTNRTTPETTSTPPTPTLATPTNPAPTATTGVTRDAVAL